MQLRRLEQIEDLFQKCRPHVVVYERYLQRYLAPLQQRKVILLDMLDSLATIGHTTSRSEITLFSIILCWVIFLTF